MPTTTTKSIGSGGGRDYSTPAAWEAACPANLVSTDAIWKGECYNDSELVNTDGSLLTVSGVTTDATRYLWLTTASGQGFKDHASASTSPLKYNASLGVAFRNTDAVHPAPFIVATSLILVENIQWHWDHTGGVGSGAMFDGNDGNLNIAMKGCLIETRQTGNRIWQFPKSVVNTLVILNGTTYTGTVIYLGYTGTTGIPFVNVAVVRPSDLTAASGNGIDPGGNYPLVSNCAFFSFGANTFLGTLASYTGGNNCTSHSSAPGSSNQVSKTFSSQFENVLQSTMDWRPKSGGSLPSNGVRADTYTADLDIIGAARSTTTPTIGAREYAAAPGGGVVIPVRIAQRRFSA